MCSPGTRGRQRTKGVPVSLLRVGGSWETGVSSALGLPDPCSQKPANLPSHANDAPPEGPGPSCPPDPYVWRLTQFLGLVPPSPGEHSPCSSDSICTEDFAARFQEAMVEVGLPTKEQEEGVRPWSHESLGGHISRVSQGSPPRPLSPQQLPRKHGAAKWSSPPYDSSPRLGPAATGTARGRSLAPLGDAFPEKWQPKRDSGAGQARSQGGSPGGPSLHAGSSPWFPLPPSPHDRRAHWDQELPLNLLPHGPAWEDTDLRQTPEPLAGPQDSRLPLGRLPEFPWDPESLLPSCPLRYRSPSSQRKEPSLSHRKGFKKEEETPQDPKPWKQKPERRKDGSPGQLRVMEATNARYQVAREDSGTSGRWQQLMPKAPASGETPRPRSPGPGLVLLGALIEAARRRLWNVHQQAETLGEAVRELQRDRLASVPRDCQGPEPSAVGQVHDADRAADEGTEAQRRGITGQRPGSLPEWLLGPRALGRRNENPQPWGCPQHLPAWPGQRCDWGRAEEGPMCPRKQVSREPRPQPGGIHGRAGLSPVLSLSGPRKPDREPSDRDCDGQRGRPSEHQSGKRPQHP